MRKLIKNIAVTALCGVLAFTASLNTVSINVSAADKKVSYTGSSEYQKGKYYTALKNVTLTGDARKDIVAVAQSQVGYREGDNKAGFSGETNGSNNYTEYGRWNWETNNLGGQLNHYWCASFISWCARRANIPTSTIINSALADDITNKCPKTYSRSDVVNGKYTPQAGDIVHYNNSHVGIVVSYNTSKNTLTTIEGNSGSDDGSNNGYFVNLKKDVSLSTRIDKFGSIGNVAVNPPANQKSTLKISMTSVPTTITKGNVFNLAGTISSNYNITKVVGSILSGNATKQTVTVAPNAKSLDIKTSKINTDLKFGTLAAGSYTLKIVATDASGASKTHTNSFTVKAAESTLKISMTSVPTTITKGNVFNLAGTVSSNYNITKVVGSILSGNATKQTVTVTPNAKSLDIKTSKINTNLKFGTLAKGSYTLKIVATDSSGASKTYTKSFTVK